MILLSFDIEEFDLPFEYGRELPFAEQLSISTEGTLAILNLLRETGIKASFFVTANYAINQPHVINQIVSEGHELASHGYYHSGFSKEHLLQSKLVLEKLSGTNVKGFRMPRMMPIDLDELKLAGYSYNSSINPTWIPGRYNHFDKPRRCFFEQDIFQLPSSVSPVIRFPLFWLSFHNLPMLFLKWLSYITYKKDKCLNIYFHPWEFTNLKQPKFGLPGYISKNSGDNFISRLKGFIRFSQKKGLEFGTISQFIEDEIKKGKLIFNKQFIEENSFNEVF